MLKKCFKCKGLKPMSSFYFHPQMKDGYLNKCKVCTRADVFLNRAKNIVKIRAYDRKRGSRLSYEDTKAYRKKYPLKYKAHTLSQKIKLRPCETCGSVFNIHRHHDNYKQPLEIRFLCSAHHSQWHAKHGESPSK